MSRHVWFLPVRRASHVQAAARLDRLYHSRVRGIASAFAAASMASRQPEDYAEYSITALEPYKPFRRQAFHARR
jgi:hypothetical protein